MKVPYGLVECLCEWKAESDHAKNIPSNLHYCIALDVTLYAINKYWELSINIHILSLKMLENQFNVHGISSGTKYCEGL